MGAAIALVCGAPIAGSAAQAAVTYNVAVTDVGNIATAQHAALVAHAQAAGAGWASHFSGLPNSSLEVEVLVTEVDNNRGNGASVTSSFVRHTNGFNIFEQGAAAEARTGLDPNGSEFDIRITLDPDYLANELWLDPEPYARTAPLDPSRTDAMSVFLHELGHAFALNGWRDWTTGALPADFQSPFDEKVIESDGNFYFTGDDAVAIYGGNVPLTFGNLMHVGNDSPRPGTDLVPDLMNGVVLFDGTRYAISSLDLAIFSDVGIPVVVPEPAMATAACAFGLMRLLVRRRTRAAA